MQRLRLFDVRTSDLPVTNGLCATDRVSVARLVNRAQQRLLYCKEAGEDSWIGTWAEVAINVSRSQPYVTLPRQIARLARVSVCNKPVPLRNQFYEYLQFGNGRMPKTCPYDRWAIPQVFQRNHAIMFGRLSGTPRTIRVYSTDPSDGAAGLRLLVQGTDPSGNVVRSLDGPNQIVGENIYFTEPFADSSNQYNTITGFQKDVTMGEIQIFEVDPATGSQVLLHTMEPGEQSSSYSRYYFHNLPCNCCTLTSPVQPITVLAIAKLEPIPVKVDQDYLIIQNLEALIEEAHSLRYSEMDHTDAKKESIYHHSRAVQFLNGELTHYLGLNNPSAIFAPFGSAGLDKIGINMR